MFNQTEKPRAGDFVAAITTSMGTIKVRFSPRLRQRQ